MLPANEWWGILETYGAAVWPAQAVFFAVWIVLLVFLFWFEWPISSLLMKLYLSVSFGWIGIVFFMTIGRGLAGGVFFGILFLVVGVLFAIDAFRGKMHFRLPETGWRRRFTLLWSLIVLCYPLFGIALGHFFPRVIVPGTFPCPTTALALVLLTTSLPQVNKLLYILLLFWAIPFPPLIQIPKYGVYEDAIMLAVGIYSLFMLVESRKAQPVWRRRIQPARGDQEESSIPQGGR